MFAQCNEVIKTLTGTPTTTSLHLACQAQCSMEDDFSMMQKEIELSLPWGTELKIQAGEQVTGRSLELCLDRIAPCSCQH